MGGAYLRNIVISVTLVCITGVDNNPDRGVRYRRLVGGATFWRRLGLDPVRWGQNSHVRRCYNIYLKIKKTSNP